MLELGCGGAWAEPEHENGNRGGKVCIYLGSKENSFGERCSGTTDKGGFPIVLQLFVLSWTAQLGLHFYSAGLKAWISQRLPVKRKHYILSVQHNGLVVNTVSQYFFHRGQLLRLYKSSMTWSSAVTRPYQHQQKPAQTLLSQRTGRPKGSGHDLVILHFMLYSILFLCHMKVAMKIHLVFIQP